MRNVDINKRFGLKNEDDHEEIESENEGEDAATLPKLSHETCILLPFVAKLAMMFKGWVCNAVKT